MTEALKSVPAQVRYINAEWKGRDEIPRIGSRETRRANTAFQDVTVADARPLLAAGQCDLDAAGFTLATLKSAVTNFRDAEEIAARAAESLAPRATNVHFADELVDGELVFDYRMHPGVVQTSNALELMRSLGLLDT